MRAILLVIAGCLVTQNAAVRTVPLTVPAGMRGLDLETSIVCRDARGAWSGFEKWSPLDGRLPRVTVRKNCRVLLRQSGASRYLASNVINDIERIEAIPVLPDWMRTARAAPAASQPYWVSDASPAAECARTAVASLCMFVSADDAGALVTLDESGLRFALSLGGASGDVAGWRTAPWARFVRVRGPGATEWSARVSVLEPALKYGRDLLQRSRISRAAVVHRLGTRALWVEGAEPESGARLEIDAPGAAATRVDLSRVRGSPLTILDVPLAPEEVIEGEVRSEGRLLAGATVSLLRLLPPSSRDGSEKPDERQRESVGEASTGATGRFRFGGLSRDEYELTVSHPRRGRARVIAQAPSVQRITLKPHALVRGRVVRGGVPVGGATVTVLPSYDAVLAAHNPATLIGESVETSADGRFELGVPDEGVLTLTALSEGVATRLDLGHAGAMPPLVELGDIRFDDAFDVVIVLELPATCVVSAAGPIGQPGVLLRKAERVADGQWLLRSVLEGRWLIEAACEGAEVALDANMVELNRRIRQPLRLMPRRQPS